MNNEIIQRIEKWHSARFEREFDDDLYSYQLNIEAFEELNCSVLLTHEFEALGKLFFVCIGGLWKMNTVRSEYEDVIDSAFSSLNSGPFGKKEPVENVIYWLVSQVMSTPDVKEIKKYTLVLLNAILGMLAVNCNGHQAVNVLTAICNFMDGMEVKKLPSDEVYSFLGGDYGMLSESLRSIASEAEIKTFKVHSDPSFDENE